MIWSQDLFLLLGGKIPAGLIGVLDHDYFISSGGTGQDDTHRRSTGLSLLLLREKYDLMQNILVSLELAGDYDKNGIRLLYI
jgi:hypothetical protein